MLLRRSAMTIGGDYDFEPADAEDLTAPILPSGAATAWTTVTSAARRGWTCRKP